MKNKMAPAVAFVTVALSGLAMTQSLSYAAGLAIAWVLCLAVILTRRAI